MIASVGHHLATWLPILASTGAEGEQKTLVSAELSTILWTWITFTLLLLALYKFAWPAIQKGLNERAEKIKADLDEARALREEAQAAMKDYQAKLDQVRREMEAMRKEAQSEGEAIRKRLEQDGQEAAEEVKKRAQHEIDLAISKARADLRREVLSLALEVAEKVTRRSMHSEDHERLAQETLTELERLTGNAN